MKNLQLRSGRRLAMLATGVVLTVVGALAGSVGTASAHHPVVTAEATCDGNVHFVASSWVPPAEYDVPGHKTNPSIEITYQINGVGASIPVTTGAFNEANGYSFSGNFSWPDGADSIVVTATATGEWAIGVAGGATWSVSVPKPAMPCEQVTTTTEQPTTTTEQPTTTTEETTTTLATTTTAVDQENPTTTTTAPAQTTTTDVSSEGPTTTISRNLPSTGSTKGSLPLVGAGLLLIGGAFVLTARRRTA